MPENPAAFLYVKGPRMCDTCKVCGVPKNCWMCGRFTRALKTEQERRMSHTQNGCMVWRVDA